jgi:hypothetical protein
MPNEQTSVPLFTSGEVLTAANMNLSAGTGVPVFSNSTTRDAGFGGAGEKVLAEGQLCYLSDSNIVQYYSGASWATVGPASAGALVYITQATPSAVNTVSVNNCFSATYQNYLIMINVSTAVGTGNITGRLRLSGTDSTTNYAGQRIGGQGTAAFASTNPTGTDDFYFAEVNGSLPTSCYSSVTVCSPAIAQATTMFANMGSNDGGGTLIVSAWNTHSTATAYDGMTFNYAGTSFTGTIRIYGYANS